MQIHGLVLLIAGWKVEEVIKSIEISQSQLYNIKKKTKEYGFNRKISSVILVVYI